MSREIIITIPGQGVEPKSPEDLLVEAVESYDELKRLYPQLITKFISPNSYGIYAALVLAGAVTLGVGIKLAVDRANLVKEAENKREAEGLGRTGMIAILGKNLSDVSDLAVKYGLDITNYNGPLAHVLGGLKDRFTAIKQEIGDKAMVLNVEGVYHHILRRGESLLYKEILDRVHISDPRIPLILSTRPRLGETADELRTELHEQMHHQVNLTEKVRIWRETGVKVVIDIGKNETMKKLTGRMARPDIQVLSLVDPKDRETIAKIERSQ